MTQEKNTSLSINGNIWNILEVNERQTEILCQNLRISPHLAKLLNLRNITEAEANNFLNPKLSNIMPNPSLLKDMDKASQRIATAIMNNQKIAIIGDYDVDGATSTSVMNLFLTSLDLFLLNYEEFVKRFEVLKRKLGNEFVDNQEE